METHYGAITGEWGLWDAVLDQWRQDKETKGTEHMDTFCSEQWRPLPVRVLTTEA